MRQGALTSSISTETLRTHSHGMRTLNEGDYEAIEWKGSEFYIPYRHTHYEPEVLLAEEVPQTQIPCLSFGIIQVTKYGEDP